MLISFRESQGSPWLLALKVAEELSGNSTRQNAHPDLRSGNAAPFSLCEALWL
jgi:hypothetical protein